jgi:hypothetical protein
MASQAILTANVASAPIEIAGDATAFPSGVFDGGHIVVEAGPLVGGPFKPIAHYRDDTPRNITLAGGGFIRAATGNQQANTSLSLTINTP